MSTLTIVSALLVLALVAAWVADRKEVPEYFTQIGHDMQPQKRVVWYAATWAAVIFATPALITKGDDLSYLAYVALACALVVSLLPSEIDDSAVDRNIERVCGVVFILAAQALIILGCPLVLLMLVPAGVSIWIKPKCWRFFITMATIFELYIYSFI